MEIDLFDIVKDRLGNNDICLTLFKINAAFKHTSNYFIYYLIKTDNKENIIKFKEFLNKKAIKIIAFDMETMEIKDYLYKIAIYPIVYKLFENNEKILTDSENDIINQISFNVFDLKTHCDKPQLIYNMETKDFNLLYYSTKDFNVINEFLTPVDFDILFYRMALNDIDTQRRYKRYYKEIEQVLLWKNDLKNMHK